METPITDDSLKQRDGEGVFNHTVRKVRTMKTLETLLRQVVKESFYGDTTGYQHVDPKVIAEARKFLNSVPA